MGLLDLFKDRFGEWMESASDEELKEAYEERRLRDYKATGVRTPEMVRLDKEISRRANEKWRKEHPNYNANPNYRWTDANRWDKD